MATASCAAAPLHRKRKVIIEFLPLPRLQLTVIRCVINRARTVYRWPTRP
jgi:hypothetical protein